eukprot:4020812-Pleurochrysis_carterae.AAC.1
MDTASSMPSSHLSCRARSALQRHILVCCPRCSRSPLRCSIGFKSHEPLARNAHLKLGGDESRAGGV